MYAKYWNLREKPFENTPNPHFLYSSQRHGEALSRMLYVVKERKGGAVFTGEYGSGKTLLCRVLLEELSNEEYQTVLIFNPILSTLQILKEIIYQLSGNFPSLSNKAKLLHYLKEALDRNDKESKNTVIVIDEAQAIKEKDSFEELRLLLNFQLNDRFLLTLILLGQPELREKINKLPQLKQRLAVRYHLNGLPEDETRNYILHRLKIAGVGGEIFQENAFSEIHRFSGGIPRRINNICDMALLVGYGDEVKRINKDLITEVAEDLGETPVETAQAAAGV